MSAITTTDHSWIKWHFSQLGEGGSMSAIWFNATLIVSGIPLALYAREITHVIARRYHNHAYIDHVRLYQLILYVAAITTAGVGLTPRDQNLLLHDAFGYVTFALYVALVVGATIIPRFLPRHIRLYSIAITLITLILWVIHAGFEDNIVSMTQVEMIGASCMFIWLWLFTNHVTSD